MKLKFKRLLSAVLAVVMVGYNLGGVIPVMADADDPTIKNPDPVELEDGVKLYKTVKSVPGYANKWEVTLRIESPKTEKTSDTVIVIDRSGSMGDDGRLAAAKTAANSLAQQLLPDGNTTNRVAVVSFASSASTGTDFTTSYSTVSRVINGLRASGGTYTQSAIHMAADLLSNSTADIKTMILLSDGEPTYSVAFTASARNDNDNFVAYGSELETSSEVDQSVFSYSNTGSVGSGGTLRTCIGRTAWGNCLSGKYYNHGNSAIAEAGYFKDSDNGTLYTIALDAGDVGTPILNAIASPDKHYTATPSELTNIFNDIAGSILSLIQSASVEDTMGHGVTVSGTGDTSIEWTPEFELKGNIFVAEKSYVVEMDESVYEQTPEDGFYSLNKSAVLTYNDGQKGEFPVPKAKPFILNVEKELVLIDKDGNATTKNDEEFKFKISGNGEEKEYTVESGGHNIIKVPMPIKLGTEYTVTETGATDESERKFENYTIEYTGNKFTVTQNHGDEIDVKIKNTYEETEVSASKVWDDDSDRDGLRQNYSDLFVAVKDGSKYVAYEALDLTKNKDYSFDGLPKNRNGSAINYTVVEARGCSGSKENKNITCTSEFTGDTNYTRTIVDGVITNKHIPATTTLTIKKKWDTSAGTLPTTAPGFVTVDVSNDRNNTVESVTLEGTAYDEWTGTFEGYKYEKGQEIHYTVKEKDIAGSALNSSNTLYIYENGALKGKWVATQSGLEITNTWTPAKTEYSGVGEFYIMKTDQDNKALSGVTFKVGNKSYTTGSDGRVKVEFSKDTEKPEDKYTFSITETAAPEYYDIIEGTEVLEATTDLDLDVDLNTLTNTYTKSFDFAVKTEVSGYVLQDGDDEVVLLVTDQALADELVIEKTFDGLTAEAFENNSQIKFEVSGPDGFDTMTVGIGDDECDISGSKLVCTIDGSEVLLPVGTYTVTESDAGIDNFTYTSTPSNGKVTKEAKLGDSVKFELKNVYTSVNTASFKVKKDWVDDEDRDGVRPDKLEVTLLADGEAYGDPVDLVESDDWEYEWTELPLMNENAEEIVYTAAEEDLGDDYDSDDGKMDDENGVFVLTNTHEPEKYNDTGELTVQKKWDDDGVVARPNTVTIVLYGEITNDEGEKETWMEGTTTISSANEWKWTFEDLYKNKAGKEITYSVQESKLGDTEFGEEESTIIIYTDEGAIEGSWTKSVDNDSFEVTNTWKPAEPDEIIYEGESEFTIKKVDENYEPLSGVVFAVEGHSDKTTDKNGEIVITVPISDDEKEESFEYIISEKEAKEGYDEVDGSATVTISCTSELKEYNTDTLVNTYIKTCVYDETSDSNSFTWDEEELILTVVNNRSMAKSLTIKKTVKGLSPEVLADLEFTIEGPEDFGDDGKMTFVVGDDCSIDGEIITCEVEGEVPTGEYTVTESNADVEHFELHPSGDIDEGKEVGKNDDAVFEITNEYEVDKTTYRIVKVWYDEHDKDGIRPAELKVNLLANGEPTQTKMLSADYETQEDWGEDLEKSDVWEHTFKDLPVADEYAEEIEYYAEEVLEAEGYEQIDEISGRRTTIFVNMHEPANDPCADGEGCGGDVPPLAPPETGKLTVNRRSYGLVKAMDNTLIVAVMMVGMVVLIGTARIIKRK